MTDGTPTVHATLAALSADLREISQCTQSISVRLGRVEERLSITSPAMAEDIREHTSRIVRHSERIGRLEQWQARVGGAMAVAVAMGTVVGSVVGGLITAWLAG